VPIDLSANPGLKAEEIATTFQASATDLPDSPSVLVNDEQRMLAGISTALDVHPSLRRSCYAAHGGDTRQIEFTLSLLCT
jgi:hypothetical protein